MHLASTALEEAERAQRARVTAAELLQKACEVGPHSPITRLAINTRRTLRPRYGVFDYRAPRWSSARALLLAAHRFAPRYR